MSSGRGWNRCCLCPRGRVGRRRGRNGSSSTGSDGGCGSVRPGGTSQTATAPGGPVYALFRRWQRAGAWAQIVTALQTRADAAGLITWDVSVDSTIARAHQHAAGARRHPGQQQEPPGGLSAEPDDHALGRSRGGLTTKIHLFCEQGQKVLSLVVTAGQRGDSPQFQTVLDGIKVPRIGAGRPRTRPEGPGRQGLLLPRKPRLPAPTRHRLHHSRTSRPTTTPQEPRPPRRPPSQVQPGRLPSPARRRMRNQPTQTPPRRRHQIRQTRRPIRSHPPHRRHQRLAPDLTLRQAPEWLARRLARRSDSRTPQSA